MNIRKRINYKGKSVNLQPVLDHPGYGAGEDGYVYSFYVPGHGWDRDNVQLKLSRYIVTPTLRPGYTLQNPDDHYDAATIIGLSWGVLHDKQIMGPIDGDRENLRVSNLKSMSVGEYMLATGNVFKGEANAGAKLTEAEVIEIRGWRGLAKKKELSQIYHISDTQITNIWNGHNWSHLGPMPSTRELSCNMCGKVVDVPYEVSNWKYCSTKCKKKWAYRLRHMCKCCVCGCDYPCPRTSYLRQENGMAVCCTPHCRQTRASGIHHGSWDYKRDSSKQEKPASRSKKIK